MPDFVLKYKIPENATLDWEIELARQQALYLAVLIQEKVSKIFFGWTVSFEVEPFGDCNSQNDFEVKGWVTDNEDEYVDLAKKAQEEVLALMQRIVFEDQSAGCWWQRVKGKWGEGKGLRKRI